MEWRNRLAPPGLSNHATRLVFHECSQMILWEKTYHGRLRFCHSTGDSLAIIFADPQSTASHRFMSFPFIPLANRRSPWLPWKVSRTEIASSADLNWIKAELSRADRRPGMLSFTVTSD
jgi:hypothetical protein